MCNSVGGGNATTQALPATPPTSTGSAAPTEVAGAAGCGGGVPTSFAPAPGNVAALQDQLAAGLKQLQGLQGPPGTGPGQVPPGFPGTQGGGSTSRFQQTALVAMQVPMVPNVDGASAIQNLQRISAARTQRVQQLEQALAADQQAMGSINPVDAQQLQLERSLSGDLDGIIAKLQPLAHTVDAAEANALVQLVNDANSTGSLDPTRLARVLIQVEGSARNLPASYLASANRGQDLAASLHQQVNQLSNQTAAAANQTGSFDPAQLQQVSNLVEQSKQLQVALKRNFELAKANPADAQARLDRALQSTDVATIIATLG